MSYGSVPKRLQRALSLGEDTHVHKQVTMQIEEVKPEQRVVGFVRKFDVKDWRDPELNLYLTLTRATDGAPPEKERKPWKDPYDDPFPLYRKEPVIRSATPPIIYVHHQVVKVLSYKDPRPLTQMVRDTLRCFRDHPKHTSTDPIREYQEVMACFQLRCAVMQWPDKHVSEMSEQEYDAMVELAAKHMTLTDCPAQEIVQLQVTTQAAYHFAMKELDKENSLRNAELSSTANVILDTKVIDIRKYYETAEVLRERVIAHLLVYNKFVDPFAAEIQGGEERMRLELEAALESVFPRKGFLYWMDLSKEEKMLQLQELAEVVTGVRIFNKYEGKGGQDFHLPNEVYEHDAVELGCATHDTFEIVNTKIHAYSSSLTKYYQEMGVNHIFIKRLRDEIAYQYQVALYLEPVHKYLSEKQETVLNLLEKCNEHLDRLLEIIGSYKVIPSDMVFPELRAIGAIHISIAQEFRHLQAQIKASTPLLKMAKDPFYRESPHTEKRLDIKRKNFFFLACELPQVDCHRFEVAEDDCKAQLIPPNEVPAVLEYNPRIEYNGFCAVCFSRTNGVLRKGDPCMGLVQTMDKKLYCFYDEDSQKRFLKAPCKYTMDVAKLVLDMPQYVHLMNLQYSPAFQYLSISKILESELVNESLPKDFGIQTEIHPWMCRWDRQELEHRKLKWQELRTHFTQTDVSHFRRENVTQTYPPKDKWTNSGISGFTSMPIHLKELHGLRGPLHNKMHTVRSTYEQTSVHNPWKEKPPPVVPITEPKC